MDSNNQFIRADGKRYTLKNNVMRFLFPEEFLAFRDCLKPKQRFSVNFLINTGARIMEAQNVKVEDIDFKRKTIILKKIKRKTSYSYGRIRIIPISTKFSKYLKEHIKNKNLGYADYLGLLSNPALNIAYKKAAIKAGIKNPEDISSYTFRKTLETWLVALDVNVMKLMAHFGHEKSTAYSHYVSTDVFSVKDKQLIKSIIGNLYMGNGKLDELYDNVEALELKFLSGVTTNK
jgi:integrase